MTKSVSHPQNWCILRNQILDVIKRSRSFNKSKESNLNQPLMITDIYPITLSMSRGEVGGVPVRIKTRNQYKNKNVKS